MDKRQRKQIIIAGVYGAILLMIIGAIIWALWPAPSLCLREVAGHKCDGPNPPCPPCELFELKALEKIWTKAFPSGTGNYDIAAQIRNPNLGWGAASFEYKFEAFDDKDVSLGVRSNRSFILPGVDTLLIENNFKADKPIRRVELSLSPPQNIKWQKLKDLTGFELRARDLNFRLLKAPETGFAELTGLATNHSSFTFQRLTVKAALLDAGREPLAINKTELYTVRAGEERFFRLTWPYPSSGEVKEKVVLVESDVFADENFVRQYGE